MGEAANTADPDALIPFTIRISRRCLRAYLAEAARMSFGPERQRSVKAATLMRELLERHAPAAPRTDGVKSTRATA